MASPWAWTRWGGALGILAAVLFFLGSGLLASDPHFIPLEASDEQVAAPISYCNDPYSNFIPASEPSSA